MICINLLPAVHRPNRDSRGHFVRGVPHPPTELTKMRGKIPWNKGLTKETNAVVKRIAEGKVGTKRTPEARERMRAAAYRKYQDPEKRARIISSRARYADTSIERIMKNLLKELNVTYVFQDALPEVQAQLTTYHPFDFIIPEHKLIVETDGCFWHGCTQCYPEAGAYESVDKVIKRDVVITAAVNNTKWTLLRFKEHDIVNNLAYVASVLKKYIAKEE